MIQRIMERKLGEIFTYNGKIYQVVNLIYVRIVHLERTIVVFLDHV